MLNIFANIPKQRRRSRAATLLILTVARPGALRREMKWALAMCEALPPGFPHVARRGMRALSKPKVESGLCRECRLNPEIDRKFEEVPSYKVGGPFECVLRAPTLGGIFGRIFAENMVCDQGSAPWPERMKPKNRARIVNGVNLNHRPGAILAANSQGSHSVFRFTLRQPRESRAMATAFSPAPSTPQLPGAGDHPSAASEQLVQRHRSGSKR
jgi:hypothetical protein